MGQNNHRNYHRIIIVEEFFSKHIGEKCWHRIQTLLFLFIQKNRADYFSIVSSEITPVSCYFSQISLTQSINVPVVSPSLLPWGMFQTR